MSSYLPVKGARSRRVPGALTFLALKRATTRNLTKSTPTEPSSSREAVGRSCKKNSRNGARLLRALYARCQDQAGNSGAEVMMLNVGHFAGLGVGRVPKRHADSARGRVPKRPTRPDVREDVEREHLARLASAVGRRIMNVIGGLEIKGGNGAVDGLRKRSSKVIH